LPLDLFWEKAHQKEQISREEQRKERTKQQTEEEEYFFRKRESQVAGYGSG